MKRDHSRLHDLVMKMARENPRALMLPNTDRRPSRRNAAYQYLQDILEFLPDATFVVDTERRVVFWNRGMEELTGVPKEKMIGNGDYVYALPFYGERRQMLIDYIDDDESAPERYSFIKRNGRTLSAEAHIKDLNGRDRYLWGTATPLLDPQGTRVGAIESIRDITEYKEFEEQQGKLEAQLHHSRMMEKFLVQLGHDLNTPLTPLFVMLPLIRQKVNDPSLIRMVDICMKSSENIHTLTQKALKLARLSSPSGRMVKETIDLSAAVTGFIGEFSEALAEKNITCTNRVETGTAVKVAPDQLKELFSNLISNAVNYTPDRGAITISADTHEEDFVTVSVSDNGWGIALEHLDHIFDEFFKSDESRHELGKSGLGLAICRKIISNHDGIIWAESEGRNRGTTIRFTLPRPSL